MSDPVRLREPSSAASPEMRALLQRAAKSRPIPADVRARSSARIKRWAALPPDVTHPAETKPLFGRILGTAALAGIVITAAQHLQQPPPAVVSSGISSAVMSVVDSVARATLSIPYRDEKMALPAPPAHSKSEIAGGQAASSAPGIPPATSQPLSVKPKPGTSNPKRDGLGFMPRSKSPKMLQRGPNARGF